MSHFTTLVVIRHAEDAADAEAQLDGLLEPFDCNAEMSEYVSWCEQEEVDRAVAFYREHPECCGKGDGPVKPFDEYVKKGDLDTWHEWTRQAVGAYNAIDRDAGQYDPDADRYGYTSTYNSNAEWDWWQLGGRWHGSLKMKEGVYVGSRHSPFPPIGDSVHADLAIPPFQGQQAILGPAGTGGDHPDTDLRGYADLARKGDIDIEGARDEAERQAHENFDKVEAACGPAGWSETKPLSQFMKDDYSNRDAAREEWAAQPLIKALQDAGLIGVFMEPVVGYCLNAENPREAYVRRARQQVMAFYSMLVDGQWLSQGGWLEPSDEWLAYANALVDQLPDDTWLAVVDCHF